jgi:hypothetical protein
MIRNRFRIDAPVVIDQGVLDGNPKMTARISGCQGEDLDEVTITAVADKRPIFVMGLPPRWGQVVHRRETKYVSAQMM